MDVTTETPIAPKPLKVAPPPPNPNFDGKQTVAKKTTKAAKAPVPKVPKGVIKKGLEPIYGGIALAVGLKDMQLATVIADNAEACAEAWETLAESNESVRRVLLSVTQTSAWAPLIMAHAPIFAALAATVSKPKPVVEETDDSE